MWKLIECDIAESTNDLAKAAALAGEHGPAAFIAKQQSAGRGRAGRGWISPEGGLWMSLLLKPRFSTELWGLIPLAAGLAVGNVLLKLGVDVSLKWPNDVEVGGKKIAGILCESVLTEALVIVGIGLNLNLRSEDFPEPIRDFSTSVRLETGTTSDRLAVARLIIQNLSEEMCALTAVGALSLLDRWKRLCPMLGQPVEVRHASDSFWGVAKDVDADGALVVEIDGSNRRVHAADVSVRQKGALRP